MRNDNRPSGSRYRHEDDLKSNTLQIHHCEVQDSDLEIVFEDHDKRKEPCCGLLAKMDAGCYSMSNNHAALQAP